MASQARAPGVVHSLSQAAEQRPALQVSPAEHTVGNAQSVQASASCWPQLKMPPASQPLLPAWHSSRQAAAQLPIEHVV